MKYSAGLLLYRFNKKELQVFLVHPGGPFWKNKDEGAWSIPKGEYTNDEDPLTAAKREFNEETGIDIDGKFTPLKPVKQNPSKTVYAWAVEGDADAENIKSNTFLFEWPPKSGKKIMIPEVDKAAWFIIEEAAYKLIAGQVPLLYQLMELVK
ncbi:NUDIX domain-containing protein [soil metagenome]